MGAPDDAQRLDSIVGPDSKRFMVHYSFPPFSVNEVGRLGGLNRREVGHGRASSPFGVTVFIILHIENRTRKLVLLYFLQLFGSL